MLCRYMCLSRFLLSVKIFPQSSHLCKPCTLMLMGPFQLEVFLVSFSPCTAVCSPFFLFPRVALLVCFSLSFSVFSSFICFSLSVLSYLLLFFPRASICTSSSSSITVSCCSRSTSQIMSSKVALGQSSNSTLEMAASFVSSSLATESCCFSSTTSQETG